MTNTLRLISLLLLLSTMRLAAQQEAESDARAIYYDTVVRLKDGTVIRDVEVSHEYEAGRYERYVIKSRDGALLRVLPSEVLVIESHARTFYPPEYNPIRIVYPCDDRQRELQWYFLELRGWVYMTGADNSENTIGIDRFAYGPEFVPGLRFGNVGVGPGVSLFRAREIHRIPVFFHLRYQLSARCFAPFLYAQAGTVFDNQSGYRLSADWMFKRSAKLLGFGAGIDYPLASWIDLSVDIGYRYLQLPTRVLCDCSDQPEVRDALYFNESHGVLLRAGVTF